MVNERANGRDVEREIEEAEKGETTLVLHPPPGRIWLCVYIISKNRIIIAQLA